jgi:hypothetical protein
MEMVSTFDDVKKIDRSSKIYFNLILSFLADCNVFCCGKQGYEGSLDMYVCVCVCVCVCVW